MAPGRAFGLRGDRLSPTWAARRLAERQVPPSDPSSFAPGSRSRGPAQRAPGREEWQIGTTQKYNPPSQARHRRVHGAPEAGVHGHQAGGPGSGGAAAALPGSTQPTAAASPERLPHRIYARRQGTSTSGPPPLLVQRWYPPLDGHPLNAYTQRLPHESCGQRRRIQAIWGRVGRTDGTKRRTVTESRRPGCSTSTTQDAGDPDVQALDGTRPRPTSRRSRVRSSPSSPATRQRTRRPRGQLRPERADGSLQPAFRDDLPAGLGPSCGVAASSTPAPRR